MARPMSESGRHEEVLDDGPVDSADESRQSQSSSASSDEWSDMTAERGYYARDGFFIKRSLRPSEFKTTWKGTLYIPRLGKERLQNEAETLRFIRRETDIPVPTLYGSFEDDGSYFLVMEYVDGVAMAKLSEDQKKPVRDELQRHLNTLRGLKSNTIGGLSGVVIPPYRVMSSTDHDTWAVRRSENREYVFCHNDLSQHNVIVNPETLEIKAIIDWEYAGFFPDYFEGHFYERPGPSVALNGEHDDVPKLLQFLRKESRDSQNILARHCTT